MSRRVLILGQDPRMESVTTEFLERGYVVTQSMASEYDFAILPPVLDASLQDQLSELKEGILVFHGKVQDYFLSLAAKKMLHCIPYFEMLDVVSQNAKLTAEGIVQEAGIQGAVIEASDCLVTGFGYCGKAIANTLKQNGACVDVIVRNHGLRDTILNEGYGCLFFDMLCEYSLEKYSYIFNTVPSMVVNQDFIKCCSPNVMIFDIASKPGGTDFEYCREHQIFATLSLGIPGKYDHVKAGKVIAHGILSYLTCEKYS